ncbi:hypothetical protein V6N11_056864 [Hibiscus sabdariffa]|uniref:Uncharacterized protein n=1 Tax=Hibiscus sabdariffa TaxID=183260 RepID=A0ABR2T5X0_9ROSI
MNSLVHIVDLVTNGSWNLDLLNSIFPPAVVPHIIAIRFLHSTDGDDLCIWCWGSRHKFEVRTAYKLLQQAAWNPFDPSWHLVWHLPIPQRIRVFIWAILQQRIMTNLERFRRSLSHDSACSLCGSSPESITHVLRDCPNASLLSRLVDHVNWPVFFAVAIWLIWKRRNDVFNTDLGSSSNVLNRSMVWAKHVCNSHAAKPSSFTNPTTSSATVSSCKWQPAPTTWITLNTDDVVSSSGNSVVGGLLRNADGSWVTGFSRAIWMTNSLHAELWAIHDGLVFAWSLGINQIQLQSDNLLAVNLLKSQDATSSSFSLVRAIATLLHCAWLVDMSWIPREGNNPADWLAKKALGSSYCPLILDSPPPDLLPLLSTDAHGASRFMLMELFPL